jgi:hypothetical protein
MSDEVRYVRLRPYDEKTGHLVRDFTKRFGGRFYRFREAGVWYEVPKALADELEKARQIPQRPNSPRVFDVCTEKEARVIDRDAEKKREEERAVEEPSVDTARKIAVDDGPGRGDLSLDEVQSGRRAALAASSARASGEDEAETKTVGRARKARPSASSKPPASLKPAGSKSGSKSGSKPRKSRKRK